MAQIVVRLDMMQTLALAAVVLFVGYGIRRRVPVLDRYNIPAPVVGGFLFAALALALRLAGVLTIEFDTTLQTPLMIAFFTTIGLGASLGSAASRAGRRCSCSSSLRRSLPCSRTWSASGWRNCSG